MSSFTERSFSKGEIDQAGTVLKTFPSQSENSQDTLQIINNWRACHSYPLQAIKMTILSRAKTIDPSALVAQRLKRLPSIRLKLQENPNMQLSQMQDIGGCRAILASVDEVDRLLALCDKNKSKNPHDRPLLIKENNYIQKPKSDGYRSAHLIYKYQSSLEEKKIYNGQRIEVQIRSKLQHAWATAVEVSQTLLVGIWFLIVPPR